MTTTASTYISKIDISYPQAGKNNNTQGFRDNFKNIQLSLSNINSDVENLQLNSVVKSDPVTNFDYNSLYKANLKSYTIEQYTQEALATPTYTTINYENGNYQKFDSVGDSVIFELQLPSTAVPTKLYELTIKVTPVTTTTVDFGGNSHAVGGLSLPVSITTTTFFDLWADNASPGVLPDVYIARRGG